MNGVLVFEEKAALNPKCGICHLSLPAGDSPPKGSPRNRDETFRTAQLLMMVPSQCLIKSRLITRGVILCHLWSSIGVRSAATAWYCEPAHAVLPPGVYPDMFGFFFSDPHYTLSTSSVAQLTLRLMSLVYKICQQTTML